MTGCYKRIGRDCVPAAEKNCGLSVCTHCGCPMGERSFFKHERTAQSRYIEKMMNRKPGIQEALLEVQKDLAERMGEG